jgi:hypothetical protein
MIEEAAELLCMGQGGGRAAWLDLVSALPLETADAYAPAVVAVVYRRRPEQAARVAAWPKDPADMMLHGYPDPPPLAGVLALAHDWPIRSKLRRDEQARRQREYDAVTRLESPRRTRWLREQLLGYAVMCATCALFGVEWPDGADEVVGAAVRLGAQVDLPDTSARQAGAAIWCEGNDVARRFHDTLRRRIWPLCASREPGEQILSAAEAVHERFGGWLVPSDALIEECRRVAAQTMRRRRHAVR